MRKNAIINSLDNLKTLSNKVIKDEIFLNSYLFFENLLLNAVENKNTIFFCGNGGSFADAQHLVAELVVRFKDNRRAINSILLGANQSNLTAIGNDFDFTDIFVRELSALYKDGDLVIILSTSGNSENTIKVANFVRDKNSKALAILGKGGGKLKEITENIIIPSQSTALIQELTILIGHTLCQEIEKKVLNKD